MDDFGAIIGAVFTAYVVAMVVHLGLSWLITREGRGLLMQGDRLSPIFLGQLAATWIAAGAVATLAAMRISHLRSPEVAAAVAVLLLLIQIRNHLKMAPQLPLGVSVVLMLLTCVGCLGTWARRNFVDRRKEYESNPNFPARRCPA